MKQIKSRNRYLGKYNLSQAIAIASGAAFAKIADKK